MSHPIMLRYKDVSKVRISSHNPLEISDICITNNNKHRTNGPVNAHLRSCIYSYTSIYVLVDSLGGTLRQPTQK